MIRLFVALELPETVRTRLSFLCAGVPGARWVAPENMHMTLRFIGDVEEPVCDEVVDALLDVRAHAFDLVLRDFGIFEQGRIVHTLWLGVERTEALMNMQAKIERALTGAGLEHERRRYTPHVTLARLKVAPEHRVAEFIAANSPFRMDPIPVGRFALFSSHLSRNGASYAVEEVFPLEGAFAEAWGEGE
ncbi:MAG: RNA 2',3'-cyclic phosphodiesterase [Alphaproteobacteria bacterium]|nr:RNA 2',3'-cyclic phosphodiesterase [Alphaproteobacteria bacterium]